MKSIFEKLKDRIIAHQNDIILFIGVILISLLSFAAGYIAAKQQEKEPLRIEYPSGTKSEEESKASFDYYKQRPKLVSQISVKT